MKVGDLVKLLGGPDWLKGILKVPKKKGIVVTPATLINGYQRYQIKWFDGTEGWVYPRDVEVISGTE